MGLAPLKTILSRSSLNFFLSGVEFDPSLLHSLGNFDHVQECAVVANTSPFNPERECCNQYPLRFPYKPLDGARSCCGDKTYQTAIMSCCAGDVIALTCDS